MIAVVGAMEEEVAEIKKYMDITSMQTIHGYTFYEGTIEPFAIQLGQVLTNMLMENKDIEKGFGVLFESSKLEFASNKTKLEFVTQMFDRGQITVNQSLSIFHLPPVKDGDKRYIRKEYTEVNNLDKEVLNNEQQGTNSGNSSNG